tara:strand:- start:448 stop:897 length:450 start_codon:yes stop_codon:yes gene_type:complete
MTDQLSLFLRAEEEADTEERRVECRGERLAREKRETWESFGLGGMPDNERDKILANFRKSLPDLTDQSFRIAARIAREKGVVTAPQVAAELRADPDWRDAYASANPKYMGAIFRRSCWTKTGQYVNSGSNGRPVPYWSLRSDIDLTPYL